MHGKNNIKFGIHDQIIAFCVVINAKFGDVSIFRVNVADT
jgi:hypothetical protein